MTRRILVVDDEPNVAKSFAKILEREGLEAQGVTSGSEAIQRYKDEEFDLALVDLKMPDVDGLDVLTALKEYDPTATVIIFTAYGTKGHAIEALRLGASEFLEKPLDTDVLIATIHRLLSRDGDSKALRGGLAALSLPSIVQISCEEQSEARLKLNYRGQEGKIYFSDGNVVHAEFDSLSGEEAVYELLSWEDGTFELEMGVSAPERTINGNWPGLLLEGMRRIDEDNVIDPQAERLPCPSCGAFLDGEGKCKDPSCPRFDTGEADWDLEFEEDIGSDEFWKHVRRNDNMSQRTTTDILQDAVDVPGIRTVVVVGRDGFVIEAGGDTGALNLDALGAYLAHAIKAIETMGQELQIQRFEDLFVEYGSAMIIGRPVGDAVIALVAPDASQLGIIRYQIKKLVEELASYF